MAKFKHNKKRNSAFLYEVLIQAPKSKVSGEIFNVGYENHSVLELANIVKKVIGEDVKLKTVPTNDNRSYHISSMKIKNTLGFETSKTISDAVNDLKLAFKKGLLPNSLTTYAVTSTPSKSVAETRSSK